MHILRMALDMYTAPRRIRCGAAVCRPAWTTMDVLAGCPIAMGALCLAVIKPMDLLTREVPRALTDIKVYVDDFTITHRAHGSQSPYDAANQLATIVNRLHELLATVDLYCSHDKNQVLTNSPKYQQIVTHALEPWHYQHVDTTKLLGVDYAGGKTIDYEHASARLNNAMDATERTKIFDIQGVNGTNAAVRAHLNLSQGHPIAPIYYLNSRTGGICNHGLTHTEIKIPAPSLRCAPQSSDEVGWEFLQSNY